MEYDKFLEFIKTHLSVLESENSPLDASLARITGEDVVSLHRFPQCDISFCQGYAIRADNSHDAPIELKSVGKALPTSPFEGVLKDGECVEVFAGSAIPEGADTVITPSQYQLHEGGIFIEEVVPHTQNICYAGFDFNEGDKPIKAGTFMTPQHISLANAMGVASLPLRRRPVITVMDDIVSIPENVPASAFHCAAPSLMNRLIERYGGVAVPSDINHSTHSIMDCIQSVSSTTDMLVIVDPHTMDIAPKLVELCIAKQWPHIVTPIHLVNQQQIVVAIADGLPVLLFPTHPVSLHICCTLFLREMMNLLLEHEPLFKGTQAVLARDLDVNDLEMDYLIAHASPNEDGTGMMVAPASSYDRILLTAMAECHCVVETNPNAASMGDRVRVVYI